ncbi:MAG TPA: molybdopterin cofactor-binding domain-containing protein, partial [Acidothermaceae bacterium]|nr:molybdopterin cofactor-binding domain-containing protein [Acidothermaceae bacterium]
MAPAEPNVPLSGTATAQREAYVGRSLVRPEDMPLLTGQAVFVADIARPGQLHARIVRSPRAHGTLRSVDISDARAVPGVVTVLTGADLPDVFIPIRMQLGDVANQEKALQRPLARDRVRYVGDPVAVVVATDPRTAEDAAAMVFTDIDELEAVMSVERGVAKDAAVLHEALGENVVERLRWRRGDVDELFAQADVVVRDRLRTQRHTGVPLETRGLVAEYDATTRRLTMWGASKVKHFNRAALARMLELPEESINLIECEVGGGFGVRGELYPEDFIVAYLACHLGRPVKWIEDRIEHLVATNHSREQDRVLEI